MLRLEVILVKSSLQLPQNLGQLLLALLFLIVSLFRNIRRPHRNLILRNLFQFFPPVAVCKVFIVYAHLSKNLSIGKQAFVFFVEFLGFENFLLSKLSHK